MRWALLAVLTFTGAAFGQTKKTATKPTPSALEKLSVDELLRKLDKKTSSSAQADAVVELGRRGAAARPALPVLEEMAKEGRWKGFAETAIEKIRADIKAREASATKRKPPPELATLMDRLNLPEAFFRKRAAEDLAKMKRQAEPALPRLKELAEDKDETVAKAAGAAVEVIEADVKVRNDEEATEAARVAKLRAEEEAKAKADLELTRKADAETAATIAAAEKARQEADAKRVAEAKAAGRDLEAERLAAKEAERKKAEQAALAAAEAQMAKAKREAAERAEREAAAIRQTAERDAAGEAAAKAGDWIDASAGWWKQGEIRVAVKSLAVDLVLLDRLGDSTASGRPHLNLYVTVINGTKTRKIDYTGWHNDNEPTSALKDNFGNGYSIIRFGATSHVRGQVGGREAIHPGIALTDHLVFEVPIKEADRLLLTLPAANFGGEGVIRFKIPRSMWAKP